MESLLLCMPFITFVSGHVPVPQPFFATPSMDLILTENSTAWLPCNVENLGESVVRWWRGDTLLADSSDLSHPRPPRMRMWLNNTLEIAEVQRNDTSEYACQVVRQQPWSPLQLSHTLTVRYPPTIFSEPKTGLINVRLGDTIEMACHAKGEPTPKVTWRSQGKSIDNGFKKQHVLILKAISPKMPLKYTCIADNGIADPSTADFQIQILYKPVVVAEETWQHVAPGLQAELACVVTAEPPALVQWLLNGQLLDTSLAQRVSPYFQGQRHSLHFRNITVEHLGEYTCRASNSEGLSETKLHLSGRARPAVLKRDVHSFNDSVQLIWQVDSYSPIFDYTMRFRQVPAPDDDQWISIVVPADGDSPGPIHTKSYNLAGLQVASTYEAIVLSRNKYGLSAPSNPFLFGTQGADLTIKESDEASTLSVSSSELENVFSGTIEDNAILQEAIILGRNACTASCVASFKTHLILMFLTLTKYCT